MSENRKCFTFIWKIKNFSLSYRLLEIISPIFIAQAMKNVKWRLILDPFSPNYKNCVACYVRREKDDSTPDQLELDYELSFLAVNGVVLHSEKFHKNVNNERYIDVQSALYVKRNEMYMFKKDLYIPDDTLTIRCRMWKIQNSVSLSGRCFAETQIETECRSFIGIIENFSCLKTNENYPVRIKQPSSENVLCFMSLSVAADGKLEIEIRPADSNPFYDYKYQIFILDALGNKAKVGKGEFHDKKSQYIILTLLKDDLTRNKIYLSKNVLTIECKITFPTGKTIESIDQLDNKFDYQDSQEIISDTMKTQLSTEEYHPESLTTLKDDLNSLFMEGILCDTKLKTTNETFPVHKAVLSARSPVFKSMFTTDMREKTNNCVDIDDLDADTVRRMLKFMYLDTLDDLEYKSAKSLYFAADKYSIASMRYGCFNFLKQNILPSNCCGILLLADKHQDKDLKKAVQDYIARNDEEVLFSEEWKNLEKNHPHLTTEVLRAVYMKNRRS